MLKKIRFRDRVKSYKAVCLPGKKAIKEDRKQMSAWPYSELRMKSLDWPRRTGDCQGHWEWVSKHSDKIKAARNQDDAN